MSLRPLVAAAVLLVATLAAESRAAFAAPGAFLISSPANGAFVTATPTLTWQASSNAASYTLTITPTTGAPFVKAGLTLSTFTIPAASPLTEAAGPYTWRVTARDAAGATTDSNSWSFFVDTTPPLAFDLVAPSDGTFSRSAGRLRWDAATDAGSGLSIYHVYVDGVSCGDTQVAGFTLSAGNCDLREGPHTWAVSAEDATGNIRWCNQAPGGKGGWVVKIDNTGPSAGDGGTFGLTSPDANAVISQQSPTFSWQAATDQGAGGVTYLLYIDGLPSGTSGQATGTVITDTSYMIPDLLSDGPHTWRVRARDAVGNATDSPTRTVTVDTTKPDLFGLSVPNNGACSMTPTPNLCWFTANDLGGVGGYQLWIDGALTSSTTGPTTACATPSSALSPGLHSWYAVALDRVGNARQSTETFQILIDYRAPAVPSLTSPANGTSNPDPPMFAWGAATDAGGLARYQVFVDGGAVATLGPDALAWLPRSDFSVGPHSWYVVAVDKCGQSTPSATGTFTTSACTPDGMAHPCPGYNLGPCMPGMRTCDAPGAWSACAGAVNPSQEICNNLDDDCDGVIDQGTNGCGGVCTLPNDVSAPCDGDDADLCKEGVFMCDGLNSVKCVETAPVNVEVCNGRDDDCNGIVDDAPGCPHPDAGSGADADPSFDGGDDGGGDDAPIADDAGVAGTGGKTGRQPQDAGTDVAHARSGSGCSCAAAPLDREAAPLVGLGLALALAVLARARARR
jgi:hypothetical protein